MIVCPKNHTVVGEIPSARHGAACILRNNNVGTPYPWRVVHGMSTTVFKTKHEAEVHAENVAGPAKTPRATKSNKGSAMLDLPEKLQKTEEQFYRDRPGARFPAFTFP